MNTPNDQTGANTPGTFGHVPSGHMLEGTVLYGIVCDEEKE